jgi:hypothetical protein
LPEEEYTKTPSGCWVLSSKASFQSRCGKNTDFDVIFFRLLFEELQATWFAANDLGRAAGRQKESQEGHIGSASLLNADIVFPFWMITGDGGG